MIGISKLYCGAVEGSDKLRYGHATPKGRPLSDRKPIVVWNTTRRCNLKCAHCYAHAGSRAEADELTTGEARALLDDIAAMRCPVVLFSGGEPLLREDVIELAGYARDRGLRVGFSTNGTLIDSAMARRLADAGAAYIGISLDGLRETNDRFRRTAGAFDDAMRGVRSCLDAGLKVGLRFTVTRGNVSDVNGLFELVESNDIPRICFYHLVYAGRGAALMGEDLTHAQARETVDAIIDGAARLHTGGGGPEVLTVDNHADGPYLYLRMLREGSPRADTVLELLRANAAGSSGVGIGCVSWDGTVHPDQFWRHYILGNIREKPFSEIWGDPAEPLLAKLRERGKHVKGRCARCRFLDICGGNIRVRAEAAYGDTWAQEPACYLTDEEIGAA